jgi:WD40 repeat protein
VAEKLFLSYGRSDDEPFVRRLYEDLAREGFDVWFDRVNMPARGLTFLKEIRDEIDQTDRLILVVGPAAINSEYVRDEWQHALVFAKAVVPILRLGEYESVPPELRMHIPDFRDQRPYDVALQELLDKLKQPVPALGPLLTTVPVLPLHFVQRKDALHAVELSVMGDGIQPIVISGARQAVALVGMGGLGKSVLAAALARSANARRFFTGGIVWVEVGERGSLLDAARTLLAVFGKADWNAGWSQIRVQLPEAIGGRSCLIVLDDLWHAGDIRVIQGSLGRSARLLLTTRDALLADELNAPAIRLDLMAEEDAFRLLSSWSGIELRELPDIARDLARECGYLPMALAICGALVRDGLPWRTALDSLRKGSSQVLSKVFGAMELSVQSLRAADAATADLYTSLAVFPSDRPIPAAAIVTWWRARGVPSEEEVQVALVRLQSKALLQIQGKLPDAQVTLHDLQFDYLRFQTKNYKTELHNGIVEAYRGLCGGDWMRVPSDGYFIENIGRHLAEAGRGAELRSLLLNFDWLHYKLSQTTIAGMLEDFDRLEAAQSLADLRRALHQSSPAISRDASQLPGQLLGRLGNTADPELVPLMNKARMWRGGHWLEPLIPSLLPPHSALSLLLTGHEGTVRTFAIHPDSNALTTAGNSTPDQTVRIWDLKNGVELHCLTGEAAPGLWTPVAFTHDGRELVTAIGSELRVWDWQNGKLSRTLKRHESRVCAISAAFRADRLASVDEAGRILVWNTESWTVDFDRSTRCTPTCLVAISPKGETVACLNADRLEVADSKKEESFTLEESTGFGTGWGIQPALRFTADSNRLLWGTPLRSLDLRTRVSALVEGAPQLHFQFDNETRAALGAPDGDFDFPSLYDFPAFKNRGQLRVSLNDQPTDRRPSCLALSSDGELAVMCDFKHRIEVWTTSRITEVPEDEVQRAMKFRFSDDSQYLWVKPQLGSRRVILKTEDGSKVNDPAVVEVVIAEIEARLRIEKGWIRRVHDLDSVVLHAVRQGALLTAAPRGKYAEFDEPDEPPIAGWDLVFRSFAEKGKTLLHGHSLPIRTGVLFTGGTRAATAGDGRVIRIWNLADGKATQILRGHSDIVRGLAVSADDRWLLSCGDDRTARVWDLRTGRLVAVHTSDRPLHQAAVSSDGRFFTAAKGPSGRIHLLRLHLSTVQV